MNKGVALTLIAALLTTSALAQDADPILIGIPVGLSGANSVVAPSIVQASELAVEEINAAGGVLGRPLELVVADDTSSAAGAQKAFDSLIFQKEVDVLISAETSAARNAGLPAVTEGDVPYLYTSYYEGRSCNPNLWIPAWVPEQQVPPLVDHFMSSEGASKFFLIGSDYAFGRGMLEFARKYIEGKGGTVVGEDYLPIDGSDWTVIVSKLKESGADAVITSTAGGVPNVTLTKQMRGAGIVLPYGNLALDEGTAVSMGAEAAGIYISASYVTSIPSPENTAFKAALAAKFGADVRTPNEASVPQYDAIYLYKAAVELAGSTDTAAVNAALPQVSFTGPRGLIAITEQHHTPLTMYLGQVQADGSVTVAAQFENVSSGAQCPDL